MKFWSRQSFGKVIKDNGTHVRVQNEDGFAWDVGREIFDREFTVADEFSSEGDDARGRVVKKVMEYPRTAMTIAFRKKVTPKSVIDSALVAADEGDLKKRIRAAMKGELRVMVGRHEGQMDAHGRLRFTDMEDNNIVKSVDPRTIEYAIVKGVKYKCR